MGMGWSWWHESPDVTVKDSDLAETLNGYDLIILNELKNGTQDRPCKKDGTLPVYVQALRQTRTPWMSILHAPQYDRARSPFMVPTLEAGNFTGFVVEHQPGSYESGAWAFDGRIRSVQQWPWLPYRVREYTDHVDRFPIVGMSGRMTQKKGHYALACAADQIPPEWRTWLWGAEPGSRSPAISFMLYEVLVQHHGWKGTRFGQSEANELNDHGDKLFGWQWWLEKNGRYLEYKGTYDDPAGIWRQMAVAVNLTEKSYAVGLEYTMIEAMNAGALPVMPLYCFSRTGIEQYGVFTLDCYEKPPNIGKEGLRLDQLHPNMVPELAKVVTDACHSYSKTNPLLEKNLEALRTYHNPQHLAAKILECLYG